MGDGLPKQYVEISGKSVLRRSVEAFLNHPLVDAVLVAIHPDHAEHYAKATAGLSLFSPVMGGATRQESVRNGLESLVDFPPTRILIHDAARCFVDAETITRVVEGLKHQKAVLPVLPVADTLKRVDDNGVAETVSREELFIAQTPQGFDFDTIRSLHLAAPEGATDDAMLAEAAGIRVECVQGSENNFKITRKEDWMRAAALAATPLEYRTGSGFDVHKLVSHAAGAEQVVHLCGVKVPHITGLEGHSDADVGLHALVDAILGTLALGDIGTHFPPSEARWKGADSAQFVTYCAEQLAERGAKLVNADITLICEAPKVGPHRLAMQARVASLLGVDASRISVKATTSEQLGFTGRREGIAAQAVATIALPLTQSPIEHTL
ncbi:MAG: bifunctional 2-C-methyl-D-erythritol 4-phosphate cytidylyltransferase/2-C-methyl-D-erythritol 2,4-cyclodiphosphate synthase [Alphaproteobacteria bacterium]|nr:bifunctional 2-C-methyl-D-erythritol 4-phosphate cytidylyltransferase/2-C-methyl-D-erythritol 2,4-cyclodiphosphate synthase [Alphaproteobacteria bacterium]